MRTWPDSSFSLMRLYVEEHEFGRSHASVLRRFQLYFMSKAPSRSLSVETISDWLRQIVRAASLKQAVRRAQLVTRFLDWLVEQRALESNPFRELRQEYCRRQSTAGVVRALVTIGNVRLEEGLIEIRDTKFFKSRSLPLSCSVVEALRKYPHARMLGAGPFGHSMIAYNGGHGVNCVGWDGFIHGCWLSGNGGAGLVAHGPDSYTSSVTITSNRIEWSQRDRILIANGSITGNYFDRNYLSGLAVTRGDTPTPCGQITITGNFFYRSGKSTPADSPESSHLRLEEGCGITCVGNAFRAGDDSGSDTGPCSPSCVILYKNLQNCVITNNVLRQGAL